MVYSTDGSAQNNGGEIFVNKPFRKLEGRVPIAGRAPEKEAGKDRVPEEDANARELFLKAVLRENPAQKRGSRPGFTLGELISLPVLGKKMRKRKPVSVPQEKDAPSPENKPAESGAADDASAFLLAMRKTRPLAGKGREVAPRPPRRENPVREQGFEELLAAQTEFTLSYSDEYLEGKAAGLDEMIMNRLRQGQMSPEASLDLHGLNAEQAFEALRFFIRDAWFKGLRVILVVTGRGKNSPAGQSVLRRKLHEWLAHEPFKRVVLAFCTAMPHDGGPGSVYVLLRKFRKKGHISWDTLPPDADLYDF